MTEGIHKGKEAFKIEANELLDELETALLELEDAPTDSELIGRIFRSMHTIKGSGAMFGFEDIASFTHEVEAVFDSVRHKELLVTPKLIELGLSSHDQIRSMLVAYEGKGTVDENKKQEIIGALRELSSTQKKIEIPNQSRDGIITGSNITNEFVTYRICFIPDSDFFLGNNPFPLLNELRDFGDCSVISHFEGIPDLEELKAEVCYTFWDIILSTEKSIEDIKDVFLFVDNCCELKIEIIDEDIGLSRDDDYKKLGEILIERGDLSSEELDKVLNQQKHLGEILAESGLVDSTEIQSALAEQKQVSEVREKRQEKQSSATIRVPSDKLDNLVNLVGELVTLKAHISQVAQSKDDPDILEISERIERLTAELRDNTMGLRMLQIGSMFSKFKRLVRDLSNDLGKEIIMKTAGEETELDKTIIEQLNDPLVHIIRNSIDHGIELPDDREKKGKPRQGIVHLSAEHSGAHILIKITDDGKGLDRERILNKALDLGLIEPKTKLSDEECFSLIFEPGFSTVKEVTNISGRGVGMDVVKKNIDALRGAIEVSSQKDFGTTFTLKLPLTLAMIDGLLIQVGESFYVFPLSMVDECVALRKEDSMDLHGQPMIKVRDEFLPYIYLREKFKSKGTEAPLVEQIVISQIAGKRIGFAIDAVIGEYQTVIKPLGEVLNGKGKANFSGATILGDGTVALILNINELANNINLK
ncbi:MAG: two-component system chemotaxis sensor kinase CheA [bacterium]|jgi:two-component system chemotaxis sensor kinase CheA